MSIIFVLIPIAMIFVVIAIAVFFWAVKTDQFDDLEKHSFSILFDEKKNLDNQSQAQSASDKSATVDPSATSTAKDCVNRD